MHERCWRVGIAVVLTLLLAGCGNLLSNLPTPIRPTPFPTLPRLPSVTPITPHPTRPLTATPSLTPTPTATSSLVGQVVLDANLRTAPNLDAAVVTVLPVGMRIVITGRRDDWYHVISAPDQAGWLFQSLLLLAPDVEATVQALP